MTCFILSWVSWEQLNMFCSAKTTPGRFLANSTTAGTSTTPAILVPQQHTKTPMRVGSPLIFRSWGISAVLVNDQRASERRLPATPAAALESTTEEGMSFGTWQAPQTKIPGVSVSTGLKLAVSTKL
jgi:hypothetical protein